MSLRPPPRATDLDPLITTIPSGTLLYRVHSSHRDATRFNAGQGQRSRFTPLRAGVPPVIVPTLYAASTIPGALSESVFHDVPYRGPAKRILVARLDGVVLSAISVKRPLRVAQLAGAGLRRVGLRMSGLADGGPGTYGGTVGWAAALHGCPEAPDGLTWTSRQDDTARAFVLFGDRVHRHSLSAISEPISLDVELGLDLVEQAATEAGIAVIR